MDCQIQKIKVPNYKKIYTDMIAKVYSHKEQECNTILNNNELSTLDIIKLNNILASDSTEQFSFNQKHKSYDRESILKILAFQKENNYSNLQIASHFKISRNTIGKWRKIFL